MSYICFQYSMMMSTPNLGYYRTDMTISSTALNQSKLLNYFQQIINIYMWSSLILCDVKWYNVILLTMCHVWYRGIPRFPSSCSKIILKWRRVEKIWWVHWLILLILSLFQGNMLYLIWVIVEEYLGCQCRWGFGRVSQCLVRSFCMKFRLNLAHVHCGTMRY